MAISRRHFVQTAGAALGGAALPQPARAAWPDHSLRWIVPFPAGGGLDAVTRLIAAKLADNIGQQVIIDNKTGGSGFIGIVALTQSKPDGYTLMMQALGMSMNPSIYKTLPYDPINDIQPVAEIGQVPVVIAAGPKVPANTLQDLIALAKKDPKKIKGASFAVGSGTLMLEMFRLQAGIELPIVQYRGVADAVAATTGGETDIVIMDGSSVVPHIKAGRLQGLAVAADRRLTEIEDIPTTVEAGLPNYKIQFWYAAFVRGGTPKPIVDQLNSEINRAVSSNEVYDKLIGMGLSPVTRSADQFTNQHRQEIQDWGTIVKQSGFTPLEVIN